MTQNQKFEVDQHAVRITATPIVIAGSLEMDQEVTLTVMGDVVKIEDKSNYDGTVQRVYHIRGTIAEEE